MAGHKVSQLQIVTAQAVISTHKGDVDAIFHQMALLGKGKSILSRLQMEAYGADINDRPRTLPGGKQRILIDDYQVPLAFKNGLAYLSCRIPTENEIATLPHVVMTADIDWDPSTYDNEFESVQEWYDPELERIDHDDPFNAIGEHRHRVIATHKIVDEEAFFDTTEYPPFDDHVDDILDSLNPIVVRNTYIGMLTNVQHDPDFELLRPLFGWSPADTIKRTFSVTTQFARVRVSDTLKQHWK